MFARSARLAARRLYARAASTAEGASTKTESPKTIGIDLGTTNSCVAGMEGDAARVYENEEGHRTTPSVVGFQTDGSRLVGKPAQRAAVTNPKGTVSAAKRLIGRRFTDIETQKSKSMVSYEIVKGDNGDAHISAEGKTYSPSQIGAFVLMKMKETAERHIDGNVVNAVITVPAYFNEMQRQATKDAGTIAGFKKIRIINEPTAAALAFGINSKENQTLAVYDLGGGTFDISILEVAGGVFEVKATGGDTFLGGEDFDSTILDVMLAHFKKEKGIDLAADKVALQRLREAAEETKRRLDGQAKVDVDLPFICMDKSGAPAHFKFSYTRAEFEKLTASLIQRSITPCEKCVKDAGISNKEISKVLLVGGMTRMPKVVEQVERIFGIRPFKGINPDEAVAVGAAIQGGIMDGKVGGVALIDVTPLSLGIDVQGGLFVRIIERNTPIPVKKTHTFTTAEDGQTSISSNILQGDRELAKDNKVLGKLTLSGLLPMKKHTAKVDVTFELNAEGILRVESRDQGTGAKASTVIATSGGLTKSEIERMQKEAEMYKEEDKKRREQIERRNDAEQVVAAAQSSLEEHKKMLNADERKQILDAIEKLEDAIKKADNETLEKICLEVKTATQEVFEKAYRRKADDAKESKKE